jgi:hypothetical protein
VQGQYFVVPSRYAARTICGPRHSSSRPRWISPERGGSLCGQSRFLHVIVVGSNGWRRPFHAPSLLCAVLNRRATDDDR